LTIEQAQRDVRQEFAGGFFGQLVSGIIWGVSAAFGTWGAHRTAIALLIIGGFFIFPLTVACLRLSGRRGAMSPGNPLNQLAVQVAFVLPLCLPLVGAATMCHINWFYPAFMIVLGAHYLPFWFLYGTRMFGVLAALLVSAGLLLGLYRADTFSLGAWVTAGTLVIFALLGGSLARSESSSSGAGRRRGPA
jgi:hypothetical protein